jgi:hypothetical protein
MILIGSVWCPTGHRRDQAPWGRIYVTDVIQGPTGPLRISYLTANGSKHEVWADDFLAAYEVVNRAPKESEQWNKPIASSSPTKESLVSEEELMRVELPTDQQMEEWKRAKLARDGARRKYRSNT